MQESGGCSREKRSLNKGTKAERYKIYLEDASLEWAKGKAWREETMAGEEAGNSDQAEVERPPAVPKYTCKPPVQTTGFSSSAT